MFRVPRFFAAILLTWLALAANVYAAGTEESAAAEVNRDMLVSTAWLAEHLNDSSVVVLCIASQPDFYLSGHIPGSRLVMLSDLVVTRDGVPNELPSPEALTKVFVAAGVSDGARVILYGEHSGLLAARAYWSLDYLGIGQQAALLDGGLEKWKAEGHPLSRDVVQPNPGTLRTYPNPDVLVSVKDLEGLLKKTPLPAALIDARPPEEFNGSKLSENVAKAGHIPQARGLYWMRNIESAENPVLRPEWELRQMYAEAGASKGKRVITYCRTGMQSSFDYFVAKYLGYEAAVYDGSFHEWSRENLPAESEKAPSQDKVKK
jgi:thiosulfate/3-mercaptopyruvate sulfurtransferase